MDLVALSVHHAHTLNTLSDLLPIGAHILNGCGSHRAGDPAETLQSLQAGLCHLLGERIPIFTGLRVDEHLLTLSFQLDSLGFHVEDHAAEPLICHDEIASASKNVERELALLSEAEHLHNF